MIINMRTLATVMIAGYLLAACIAPTARACQTDSYALISWDAGVVVWKDELPSDAVALVQRLNIALTATFEFWEQDVPTASENPEEDQYCLRIYDPGTQTDQRIPALRWNGEEIRPLIVYAFPDRASMARAIQQANTSIEGMFVHYSIPGTFQDAECWMHEAGRGTRNLLLPATTSDAVLMHELTHWFAFEFQIQNHSSYWGLPDYIMEGMAEYTSAPFRNPDMNRFVRADARSWANSHCLLRNVNDPFYVYPVGETFVQYVIEQICAQEFLDTLGLWATRTLSMTRAYQAGWREWLGLHPECP